MRSKKKGPVVAIDGPVASGKSSVGERVAEALGCLFVDTGLMYRAVALLALELELGFDDVEAIGLLAEETAIRVDGPRVWVDEEDIAAQLRTRAVDAAAARVATVPQVREALVAQQRALAAEGGVVMAGRDIGTVVLPRAPVKVFLKASAQERARRRYLETKNPVTREEEVLHELLQRDRRDTERKVSPLRPAVDAHIIETDGLSLDEVVERVIALVRGDA